MIPLDADGLGAHRQLGLLRHALGGPALVSGRRGPQRLPAHAHTGDRGSAGALPIDPDQRVVAQLMARAAQVLLDPLAGRAQADDAVVAVIVRASARTAAANWYGR